MRLLDLYRDGKMREVWDELLCHGASVRNSPACDEAEAVVRESMLRVRSSVTTLIAGLNQIGFQFGVYPDGKPIPGYTMPFMPPRPDVEARILEIETLVNGPMPMSLAGFWRYVGSVNLAGTHPDFEDFEDSEMLTDPLWVEGPETTISELNEWLDASDSETDDIHLVAVVAPDALHKANISGGPPYEIELPDGFVDGVLRNEGRDLRFVEYLRQALDWGGFPGFSTNPDVMPNWLDLLSEQVVRF